MLAKKSITTHTNVDSTSLLFRFLITCAAAMPPPVGKGVPIDEEWAASLIGLRMQVPNLWWKGFEGDESLNEGMIIGVDFSAAKLNYFQLELAKEKGAIYAMRYDAVHLYADVEHRDFWKFRLPRDAPSNPANEDEVIAPPPKTKTKHIGWMLDDDYSEGDDGDDGEDGNADDDSDDSGDDFVTPKRNKQPGKRTRKKRETTINPGLVFGAVDFEDAADDDNDAADDPEPKKYSMTEAKHWKQVDVDGGGGRVIEPVPYTGEGELFAVKLRAGELAKMRDKHGTIRFSKVFDWLLPKFEGGESFYEFIAARMRNYMLRIIKVHDPLDEKYIAADHVARFFGCQLVRTIKGLPSIDDCWSTREALDAVGTAKESMPRSAFVDMHRCMHFADDWDEEDGDIWTDSFADGKVESPAECAWHRRKFAIVEDAFNRRWKEAVTSGRRLTMDESRTPGWYHGPITQGPEPKPYLLHQPSK